MTSEANKLIYTLGTSTRSATEFFELLTSRSVEVLVDVRRFPTSRFDHFRRERLAELSAQAGIDYLYMGQELGGYRRGGYRAFTTTPEFQAGIDRLSRVALTRRVAFVCAERFPWRCHRRFIALELERRGWQVTHIIDVGRDWLPSRPQLL